MRLALAPLLLLAACQAEAPAPDGPVLANALEIAASPGAPKAGLDRSRAGRAAPETSFQDPDGESVTLADFRGKPLLLNLWATWCSPCVAEMPTLDTLAAREGEKLQVLTLSHDDKREKAEAFLAKRKLSNLEAYIDTEFATMSALGVQSLPTTILYDAEGREVWRVVGDEDWAGEKAATLIAEARPR
jgi:thiol-disulfide isomerase/thioredoxin